MNGQVFICQVRTYFNVNVQESHYRLHYTAIYLSAIVKEQTPSQKDIVG